METFGAVSFVWESDRDVWRERTTYEWLLGALEQAGVPTDVTHFQKLQQQPKRLKSRDHLLDLLTKPASYFHLVVMAPSRQPPLQLSFVGDKEERGVNAHLWGPDWGTCSAWLPRFVERLYREPREGLRLGRTVHVQPRFPTPSLRPPRRHDFLVGKACRDVVTRSSFQPLEKDNPEFFESCLRQFEILATADLPEGVRRRSIDPDLIIIEWAAPEATEVGLCEALVTKQRWLRKHFAMDREPFFNEVGDKRIVPWGFTPHPHVTLYGDGDNSAFQTMVPFDGKLDPAVLDRIRSWREQGTPDGQPLRDVTLLLPNRNAAVSLRAEALATGFQGVLYVEDDGSFRDPFPEGEWIEGD